ncbi:endonuclease [Phytoactinopolyspora sp. XMNu-373]|uniref:Endonuclease n=2 Tax=Phytoactinopolyspora mesophila TaxID=2650750 RepID=A0A7K3M5S0_9ACTN|nr:endonuclease [Phytoactinopolyspora mesophila]
MSSAGLDEPLIGPAEHGRVHVMTYNVRYAADDPGHLWEERRPVLAQLLDVERPCVIGTQEGLFGQVADIAADLPSGYEWIGQGREGGSHGEYAAVFFDTRRVLPREYDHVWLSETPGVVGSTTFGNLIPRMATWVRFSDVATAGEFVVVNTHLDHASADARRRGAAQLADLVESMRPAPVIVTGDFNAAAETSEPYLRLVAGAGLVDTWLKAAERRTPAYATFGGYAMPKVGGERIDWILTTPEVTPDVAAINPFRSEGRFPSDHVPVQALLRLPSR